MASSVGRGRGYGGRNKELRRPGQVTEVDTPSPVSQRLIGAASTAIAQSPSAHHSDSRPSKNQKPPNSSGQKPTQSSSGSQKPSQSLSGSQNAGNLAGGQQKSSPPHLPPQQYTQKSANMAQTTYPSNVHVLNKPNDPSAGGPNSRKVSQEERNFCGTGSLSDENSQSVLYIDERYAFLIKQVSLLSNEDDGIMTNQKLQYINSILTKMCTQPQMLRQALDAISSAAILDSRMSGRISLLCCSVWFSRSQLLGHRLHHLFIESMTDKIDGLEISLEGADQYLVNAASLLADIYTETKMLGTEELVTLARLIVQVSIELLECNTQLALRTLNVQLMQHGRKLYQCVPDKLESLSISARKLLISRQPPAPSCKIWLMLLSDQCLYKLEPLPKYLQDFYARHLDDSTSSSDQPDLQKDRLLQAKQKDIAKQDTQNKTRDATSKDNRTRKSDSSDRWSTHSNGDRNVDHEYSKLKDDVFEDKNPLDSSYDSSGVSDSNFSDNNEYCSVNGSTVNSSFNSERKPRPILGAGSRMVQNSNVKSDFEFNEPPPGIMGVNDPEELIPKFCPSVPPPNFVPRVKQATSASQDNTDFWNKPPPSINTGSKMESVAPKMPPSALAGRLDLNSWRQQANGLNEEEQFSNQPTYNPHRQRKDSFENQSNFYANSNEKQTEFFAEESIDPSAHFHYGGASNTAGLLEKVKTASTFGKQNPNDYHVGDLEWKQGWNEETAADYENEALDNSKDSEQRLGRSNSDLKDKKNPSSRMNNYEPQNEYATYRSNAEEEDNYDHEEGFKKLQIETGTLMWSKNVPDVGESGDKSSEFDRNGDKGQRRSGSGRHQQKNEKDRRSSDTRQDRNFNRERKENDEKDSNWRRRDSDESKNTRNSESKQDSGKWSNKSKEDVEQRVEDWNEDGNERSGSVSGSTTGLRRDQRGSGRVKRDPMESSRSASYWTHDDRCDRDYDG